MSYNGQMNFGLLGDFDVLPDLDVFGANIAEELATLGLARTRVRAGSRVAAAAENLPSERAIRWRHC